MIYIDIDSLEPELPPGWETKAAKALAELEAAGHAERSDIIDKYSSLWRELAPVLKKLSHKKCWYCESREDRSDNAVDHFRPKRTPIESPDHPGYWWLAFNWKNYRYCCTFCNEKRVDRYNKTRGGKGSHFPLVKENVRATDETGIEYETPILLDPTKPGDTTLLYFDESGVPQSRHDESHSPILCMRARESIKLYHLDHVDLIESRREVASRIKKLVDLGNTYLSEWGAENLSSQKGYNFVIQQMKEMLSSKSTFSSTARDVIRGFRDDKHRWVDSLL